MNRSIRPLGDNVIVSEILLLNWSLVMFFSLKIAHFSYINTMEHREILEPTWIWILPWKSSGTNLRDSLKSEFHQLVSPLDYLYYIQTFMRIRLPVWHMAPWMKAIHCALIRDQRIVMKSNWPSPKWMWNMLRQTFIIHNYSQCSWHQTFKHYI